MWDLFLVPEEREQFKALFRQICDSQSRTEYESSWVARDGSHRTIAMVSRGAAGRQADAHVHHCFGD